MKNKYLINFLPFLLIILVSIPIVLPFFKTGYFPTHDGQWAVVRLADMFRSLRDLQIPVRFSGALNFGYGYPLFNFAYPFPYYLGIVFYFFTHSFVESIKILFMLSVFLSGIFMYAASYELWRSRLAGFVSAILYLYLPYRMVDLYVRGSLGESLSFALFPLIFYLSLKLFNSSFLKIIIVFLALSVGVIVMTHNIMTVLYLPVLLAFILYKAFSEKQYSALKNFFLSIFLGIGLSAFFWFPALFEKGNILLSRLPIADREVYFVKLGQLLVPSWGYAPPTEIGGFSYQLGISQIAVILILVVVLLFRFFKKKNIQTPAVKYASFLLFLYVLYFLMLFSFISIIWKTLPLLKEINYPWTMLSQLGFLTALLSGFLVIQSKRHRDILLVISFVSIFLVLPYAKPVAYNSYDDNYYLTNEATTTSSSELMPLWVRQHPKKRFVEKIEVLKGKAEIKNPFYNSKRITFDYIGKEESTIRVNTIYYPGWRAFIENKEVDISYANPMGVMEIKVPNGEKKVTFKFLETTPRMIANLVSIISLLTLLLLFMRSILSLKK